MGVPYYLRRPIAWGLIVHTVLIGLQLPFTYASYSSEFGERWVYTFMQVDLPSTVVVSSVIPFVFNKGDAAVTPEPQRAFAVLVLFVAGSIQWAAAFAFITIAFRKIIRRSQISSEKERP